MTRTSRRRTLSHDEIENFLSEISTTTASNSTNVDNFLNRVEIDEDREVDIIPTEIVKENDEDRIREFCKVRIRKVLPC